MGDSSPQMDEQGPERNRGLSSFREEILRTSRSVRDASLRGSLEAEVVSSLIDGEKTVTELVEMIFPVRSDDPDFNTHYMRVWRATQDLASNGYVVKRLFGRERPYRLTRYGVERLFSGSGTGRPGLVAWIDISLYMATILFASLLLVIHIMASATGNMILSVINPAFFFLLGVSSLRMIQTFVKVS